jgi:four helix bundle protein
MKSDEVATPDRRPRGMKSVEDLEVFKLAHGLVLRIYEVTRSFPRTETFGLVAQLRRAAASVPANLVEGAGRLNRAEYRQFAGIAKGSAAEASYHLLLARDLKYVAPDEYERLRSDYDRVGQMLTRLTQALS